MTDLIKKNENKPKRIQRKRTREWRMPENTVYVGRGSKWGNPFKVGVDVEDNEQAVEEFEFYLAECEEGDYPMDDEIRAELRGKNLACWCALDKPCHADVLLEIANTEEQTNGR